MIRLLVADDQMLVRKGIIGLLSLIDDIEVVAEADDGEAVLRLLDDCCLPDMLLLDVRMPKLTGVQVLQKLGEQGRMLPTILLTTFDDEEAFLLGMKAGAKGFLLKDVSVERLEEAIRTVHHGGSVIRPALTERVTDMIQNNADTSKDDIHYQKLTPRELQILRLMAAGYSNREIADAFDISEGVVKNHGSSIFSKLGVRDRTRAVLKAIENGFL
jgi:DNA-binding NarL/FixJ family response regulator